VKFGIHLNSMGLELPNIVVERVVELMVVFDRCHIIAEEIRSVGSRIYPFSLKFCRIVWPLRIGLYSSRPACRGRLAAPAVF
jgi:hypothetical protein